MLIKFKQIFKDLKIKQLNGLVIFIACRNFSKTDQNKIEIFTVFKIWYYTKKRIITE
jgi:hypothetical protein